MSTEMNEKELSYIDNIDKTTDEVEDVSADDEKFDWKAEIISWIKIFVFAIVFATILDNFIILNATVPTGSMENTIAIGDHMIGNRLAYKFGEPQRGDVIIFKFPDDENQLFVKRIIGLPGEKVKIKDGKVYINDSAEPLKETYVREAEWGYGQEFEYEVPSGSYFVMGDNRNNSNDSRYWRNHFVREDKILAKAFLVYWPFERIGGIEGSEY